MNCYFGTTLTAAREKTHRPIYKKSLHAALLHPGVLYSQPFFNALRRTLAPLSFKKPKNSLLRLSNKALTPKMDLPSLKLRQAGIARLQVVP